MGVEEVEIGFGYGRFAGTRGNRRLTCSRDFRCKITQETEEGLSVTQQEEGKEEEMEKRLRPE